MESKRNKPTPPHRSTPVVLILAFSVILSTLLFFHTPSNTNPISISYDQRAITINGQRRILIAGSIHYPRSTPEMWPDLIQKAKDGGLEVIQTYVFWDRHEPSPGKYYFEGRYDLVRFIKLVKEAGLFVHLRLGPYICAEWNFGGFPVWLKFVPGISFRTDNEPFKAEMEKFTKKIVNMMKTEKLYAWQGGPIILSQIENEYGPVEHYGGPGDKVYAAWTAKLALDLHVRVPWIMCKQVDAPDPIIDTCNGFYCDGFTPNKPYKPKLWTEAWTGWFSSFGGPIPHRPIEDLAYSVVKFIQNGGSLVSYYMYHGGTNFGRTAGNFIATSYDYDAPVDEYGLIREPKWGHLRDLHEVVKSCEPALVYGELTVTSLGYNQQSYVYSSKSGACAAFLANNDTKSEANVEFNGMHYELPPWSISILPDCKTEVFNTARIRGKAIEMRMTWIGGFSWKSYNELMDSDNKITFAISGLLEEVNLTRDRDYDTKTFTTTGLLEQVNVTRDLTDYLWYRTYVNISEDEHFLKNGQDLVLTVSSAGPSLHVYVNGQLTGIAYGGLERSTLTFAGNVKLQAGSNEISILSVTVGLYNGGTHFESWNYGVLGPVILDGLNVGKRDLSMETWTYQVGLKGEGLNLHSLEGISSVDWGEASTNQPLTWYKAFFDAPEGNDPLALDMRTMGKGLVWINGHNIGRYWPRYKAQGICGSCNYRGRHNEALCVSNCGESSQTWSPATKPAKGDKHWMRLDEGVSLLDAFNPRYHLPRSWLKPRDNLVVLIEEWGGNPDGISLVKREINMEIQQHLN